MCFAYRTIYYGDVMKEDVIITVESSYLALLSIIVLGFPKKEVTFAIIMFAILDFCHFKKELL